jgi:pimeloyl-ACP methyl ester carboxylesterase
MANDITRIQVPTLLVWGLNDTITPPIVGYEFNKLIPKSHLYFIDHCCHAPMMEHPEKFNKILNKFLEDTVLQTTA